MQKDYNNGLRGISQAERAVIDTLTRMGKSIIRAENLRVYSTIKGPTQIFLLSRLAKKGWLQRLGAGGISNCTFGF